jgi:hypothetical protein
MDMGVFVVGALVCVVFAFVLLGGPAVFAGWVRHRRQEAIRRQIALTDAIHGSLGAVVSPVVRKPLVGAWQVQIAVPFTKAAVVGRILATTNDVFSALDGSKPDPFRVVLTGGSDQFDRFRPCHMRRAATQWADKPVGA